MLTIGPIVAALGSSIDLSSDFRGSSLCGGREGRLGSIDSYHLVCSVWGAICIRWWAHVDEFCVCLGCDERGVGVYL